jgi:hypothetical protein
MRDDYTRRGGVVKNPARVGGVSIGACLVRLPDRKERKGGHVTDGPFAETREWIGGFDLLDCASIEEAVEIASKHPMARFGTIEVRPLWGGQ